MVPDGVKERIAKMYNATLRRFGEQADFMAAVGDLTAAVCEPRDREWGTPEGVFCQSIGSRLQGAASGQFPLNMSYHLVRHFSGDNDGLVSESSFAFGERYRFLTPEGDRGISHGDMIDLNRENIPGFDVREFYVELVHDLKKRGL
jgi:triacylglycerol lipase